MNKNILHSGPERVSEILYGRAGLLHGLLWLQASLPPSETHDMPERILNLYNEIIEDGKQTAKIVPLGIPLVWTIRGSVSIGAAHGMSGIATVLLQTQKWLKDNNAMDNEYEDNCQLVKHTIDWILLDVRLSSGNWPSSIQVDEDGTSNRREDLIQWCHGAPGVGLLALEAYRYYDQTEYLDIAKSAADYVCQHIHTINKGVGLCHGVAGNAYLALNLYALTKDEKYTQQLDGFLHFIVNWKEKTANKDFRLPDYPWSMWEGLAGAVWFLLDFDQAKTSGLPWVGFPYQSF